MKRSFVFILFLFFIAMTFPLQARAGQPQLMTFSCQAPYTKTQTDLVRPIADGDQWTFTVALEGDASWVSKPQWYFNGQLNLDPQWGLFDYMGDNNESLTWNNPAKTGDFHVKMKASISCGSGGGGQPIEIEADWSGNVDFDLKLTWDGSAHACAGGVAVDGVHDFMDGGTLTHTDGSPAKNVSLKLSFENNRGHDYSNDPSDIKPPGWTVENERKAKFIVGGDPSLVEETTVTTDDKGEFKVHVLSSDIISSDIKIKATWENPDGEDKDMDDEETCNFEQATSFRGFDLDPAENSFATEENENDNGWWFDPDILVQGGDTTTARFYLKYNALPVDGHRMKVTIDDITAKHGYTISGDQSRYVSLEDEDNQPTDSVIAVTATYSLGQDEETQHKFSGVAYIHILAGSLIYQVKTITLKAEDETQGQG